MRQFRDSVSHILAPIAGYITTFCAQNHVFEMKHTLLEVIIKYKAGDTCLGTGRRPLCVFL